MGIDFNNLKSELFNIGKGIAKQGANLDKIDTQSEKLLFDSEIENKCASAGVDASEIYNDTSISSLMGASFSTNVKGEKDDLSSMFEMAGISAPVNEESTSRIGKNVASIEALNGSDFSLEFLENVLGEDSPVIAHLIDNNSNGTSKRISAYNDKSVELEAAGFKNPGKFLYALEETKNLV